MPDRAADLAVIRDALERVRYCGNPAKCPSCGPQLQAALAALARLEAGQDTVTLSREEAVECERLINFDGALLAAFIPCSNGCGCEDIDACAQDDWNRRRAKLGPVLTALLAARLPEAGKQP